MTTLGTHFERHDLRRGRFRHVQHVKPIAYRDAHGKLRRVATAFQDSGLADYPHLVSAAPFGVSVSNGGEIRYHPTRELDVGFQIGDPVYRMGGDVRRYDLGTPERSGNRLTWLTEHLRMDYLHGGHFGKLGLLFRSDAWKTIDDRELAFPIAYAGCERQGGRILIDGQTVMILRPFVAYDAAALPSADALQRVSVPHQFRTAGGKEYLVVTLPLEMDAWSKPVLDPTFQVQPDATDGKDAHIVAPDLGSGNAGEILLSSASDYRALIQFDLSTIPATATVTAASLEVELTNGTNDACALHRILPVNDWVEASVKWHLRKTGTAWAGADGCDTAGTDYDATAAWTGSHISPIGTFTFTLTADGIADVQGWIDGSWANNGFILFTTEGSPNDGGKFRSSDYGTAADRPIFTVEYTASAAAPATSAALLRRARF